METKYLILIWIFLCVYSSFGKNKFPNNEAPSQQQQITDSMYSVIGSWNYGQVSAVETDGQNIFMGNGQVFQILDNSVPDKPKLIGEYDLKSGGTITEIKIKNNIAYVAAGNIYILDVSNIQNIKLKSSVTLRYGGVTHIALSDSMLIATAFYGYLYVVDIYNSEYPIIKTTYNLGSALRTNPYLTVKNNYIFISSISLQYIDIFKFIKPDSIVYIKSIVNQSIIRDIALSDSVLYVLSKYTSYIRIYSYSIKNPEIPVLVTYFDYNNSKIDPTKMVASEKKIYVLGRIKGDIAILDYSNAIVPREISYINNPQFKPANIVENKKYIYAASYCGLWVLNKTKTDSLVSKNIVLGGGNTRRIVLRDSLLFVASEYVGMWILNVTNPQKISTVSSLFLSGIPHKLIIEKETAFIASDAISTSDTSSGLWSVDILHPENPKILAHIPNNPRNVIVNIKKKNNLLFVLLAQENSAVGDTLLRVYDVGNPRDPALTMIFINKELNMPEDLEITDSLIFVSFGFNGLKTLKYNINSISEYDNKAITSYALLLTDSTLISFSDTIYTIRNGNDLKIISSVYTDVNLIASDMNIIQIKNSILIGRGSAVYELDSKNYSPKFYVNVGIGGRGVQETNGIVFISLSNRGIAVIKPILTTVVNDIKNETIGEFEISQNFPNPFNPTTTIIYELPITSHVSLTVYDVLGREVATLVNEEQSSGKRSVTFNALSLSSGVYFYRLRSGSIIETKRMVLMK